MKFKNFAAYSAVITIGLSHMGCATYWRHPSKPASQLSDDQSTCVRANTQQVCTPYGPSSTTKCKKNSSDNTMECVTETTPGGTRCSEDTNHQMVKRCLNRLGWRETDSEGRYK